MPLSRTRTGKDPPGADHETTIEEPATFDGYCYPGRSVRPKVSPAHPIENLASRSPWGRRQIVGEGPGAGSGGAGAGGGLGSGPVSGGCGSGGSVIQSLPIRRFAFSAALSTASFVLPAVLSMVPSRFSWSSPVSSPAARFARPLASLVFATLASFARVGCLACSPPVRPRNSLNEETSLSSPRTHSGAPEQQEQFSDPRASAPAETADGGSRLPRRGALASVPLAFRETAEEDQPHQGDDQADPPVAEQDRQDDPDDHPFRSGVVGSCDTPETGAGRGWRGLVAGVFGRKWGEKRPRAGDLPIEKPRLRGCRTNPRSSGFKLRAEIVRLAGQRKAAYKPS
jgi:hypothetical protein